MRFLAIWVAVALAGPAQGQMVSNDEGTLNPEELSLKGGLDRLKYGEVGPVEYALGYGAAMAGRHDEARQLFERAAEHLNSSQAMTMMSWLNDNVAAGPENPEEAAMWDRRAAETGSEVGMFNYGLDILRGYGVAYDAELGRDYIRRAAALGSVSAQHLIDNEFNLDVVTPDVDEAKYGQKLY